MRSETALQPPGRPTNVPAAPAKHQRQAALDYHPHPLNVSNTGTPAARMDDRSAGSEGSALRLSTNEPNGVSSIGTHHSTQGHHCYTINCIDHTRLDPADRSSSPAICAAVRGVQPGGFVSANASINEPSRSLTACARAVHVLAFLNQHSTPLRHVTVGISSMKASAPPPSAGSACPPIGHASLHSKGMQTASPDLDRNRPRPTPRWNGWRWSPHACSPVSGMTKASLHRNFIEGRPRPPPC